MCRYAHDRAGTVTHQNVVRDIDRHFFVCERIDRVLADEHTGLFVGGGSTFDLVHVFYFINIFQNRFFVFRSLDVFQNGRIFRRQNHESRAVDGVHTGREHGQLLVGVFHLEVDFTAIGLADPVFLHRSDLGRPAVQLAVVEVLQQTIRVIGDLEIPLGKVFLGDRGLAAFAGAVDHLFVSQYGLAARTPVDRVFFFVSQSFFKELNEDPLHPPVIILVTSSYFSVPIVGKAEFTQLLFHFVDIVPGPFARMDPVLDRRVLCRQAERVEAHRMQDIIAVHFLKSGYHVADGIVPHMAHMQLA